MAYGDVMAWLLETIPEHAKEKDRDGYLPLHYAAMYNESEAVIKAVLDAYPEAVWEKDNVRCGRGRRVVPSLLSLLTHALSPFLSLSRCCAVQDAAKGPREDGRDQGAPRGIRQDDADGTRDERDIAEQAICVK